MRKYLPGDIEIITCGQTTLWRRSGVLHREGGPALVRTDGTRRYYRHGVLHRENGPAVVHADGTILWFRNGILHRDDGPAVVHADGREEWFPSETEGRKSAGQENEPQEPGHFEAAMEIIATYGFQEIVE